jgi:hypothetical protein
MATCPEAVYTRIVLTAREKPRPRKSNRGEVARRRAEVFRARLRGLSYLEIAEEIGVSTWTVRRDLGVVRAENVARLESTTSEEIIAEELAAYQFLLQRLWEEHEEASPDDGEPDDLRLAALRLRVLEQIRRTLRDRHRVLVDTGVLAAKGATLDGASGIPWTSPPLDAATLAKMRELVMGAALTRQLPEPEPEPVAG